MAFRIRSTTAVRGRWSCEEDVECMEGLEGMPPANN
eukprot:CAMPEP_0194367038 /NCGR_PEP_ID=MMETSP0174-20130528/15157_1 /TAXON_ID=216777 /ORGANISM="Proboscia alata, Strain PI-D3" /LENGTH=35 /DNA_ID= /DNA_START= /DNA_END= /DNA_ORIENTATION=